MIAGVGLVAAALLAWGPEDEVAVRGLEWDRVQVEWIAAATRVRALEDVLPRRHAVLVRQLGNPDYEVRWLATGELARMGRDASEALAWGLRVRDPEVRDRAGRLRERLYRRPEPCHSCGGTGEDRGDDDPDAPCPICGGRGWSDSVREPPGPLRDARRLFTERIRR
jgi:hypothetical protein